jgi:hypothetical protein
VASLVSTEFSIITGGLACIAGAALLTGLLPGFRRYDRRNAPLSWSTAPQPAGQPEDGQSQVMGC